MSFISSNIAITNRIEEGALFFYNGTLTEGLGPLTTVLQPIEKQIFSRVVGSLISVAAIIEIAIHIIILPFSILYAIGKSIYQQQCDFILPWQHLQRIRDAVFPALFGSIFGLIHPYLGTFAAEPTKKHIATGILLSNTDKAQFDSVCSPLTTMSEVTTLCSQLPDSLRISEDESALLEQVAFWEGEFEKIQSIDFFTLNITFKVGNQIQLAIDETDLPQAFKEIIKRVALVTYPIFVVLDLTVMVFATAVCLGTLVVKLLGGQSPAYLEKAWTPEVLIYNIVKIPLFLISATVGFIVALVHPETGLLCVKYPVQWMAKVPFLLKMLGLKLRLCMMDVGEVILLPAVQTFPDDQKGKLHLLPSYGSHMRYLLVEKTSEDHFQAELIERGTRHKKTVPMSRAEMGAVMQDTLAQRYQFAHSDSSIYDVYNQTDSIIDLGTQPGLNNCVITNLFASLEVIRDRMGRSDFTEFCKHVKQAAGRRYYLYASDFYPFGKTAEVLQEIDAIFHGKI